jgi:hypothetical protein
MTGDGRWSMKSKADLAPVFVRTLRLGLVCCDMVIDWEIMCALLYKAPQFWQLIHLIAYLMIALRPLLEFNDIDNRL